MYTLPACLLVGRPSFHTSTLVLLSLSLQWLTQNPTNCPLSQYQLAEESPYGYSELLEVLSSIAAGFMQPLKEEHRVQIFEQCLVPLHRCQHIKLFHT